MNNPDDFFSADDEYLQEERRHQEEPTQTATIMDAATELYQLKKNIVGSPFDRPAAEFAKSVDARTANHDLIMRLVGERLVRDVDYGKIHVVAKAKCSLMSAGKKCTIAGHYSKDSLFKSGAEKICVMLGLSPRYPQLEQYETKILGGWVPDLIVLRCELVDFDGRLFGVGVGARKPGQDYGDINKALKMAEKSAQIDATIRTAGLSSKFTQDVEDMGEAVLADTPKAEVQTPLVSEAQLKRLEARIGTFNLNREHIKDYCIKKWGAKHFKDLTPVQYRALDKKIDATIDKETAAREAQRLAESSQGNPATSPSSEEAPGPRPSQSQPEDRSSAPPLEPDA